ncbi:MAG TPA: hypothetical protein VNJ08_02200 [Bacteriovoracaceae bacterium]|nr:hypothetical protein [Bacteriovoracaceae bacterium]
MKTWTLALLAIPYLSTAAASNDFAPLITRLDQRINTPVAETTAREASPVMVPVPLDLAFKRESSLWTSISNAYDLLRSYDLPARHRFLYFASKANAKAHPDRIQSLKTWIKEENHLVQSLGMPKYFNTEWNIKIDAINTSIAEFEAPYPALEVKPTLVNIVADDKNFLVEIKNEIETTANAIAARPASGPAPAPQVSGDLELLEYALYLGALFVAFLVGFTFRKSKENELKKMEDAKTDSPPALPELNFDPAPVMTNTTTFYFDQGVNIEEECRKVIEQSSHLLQIAQLKVLPTSRSPFKTAVDAPADKVSEALAWLLKGTLAIANSHGGKVSHLEWHCREQFGRVSLEFTLHGLECDLKGLYLNTLVEGDASAPAHFGRSEMALAEHLASIGFKAGNKKTTISLGLDTLATNLSH